MTARASRTPVSAQPQWDVIQLCLSSSISGWLSFLSGAGMLPSAVSLSIQRVFLYIIRTIARRRLRAQKGPLYIDACVRSEHTKGHQTVIDEWIFSGTCCIWCLDVLRVALDCQTECSGVPEVTIFPGMSSRDIPRDMSPGVVPADVAKVVTADAASLADDGTLSLPDHDGTLSPSVPVGPVGQCVMLSPSDSDSVGPVGPYGTLSPSDSDPVGHGGPYGTLSPTDIAGILFPANFAELFTVGVADVAVFGAAPLVVTGMFPDTELVTMIVTDDVETVHGSPVDYDDDYDDSDYKDSRNEFVTVDGASVCNGGDGDDAGCKDPGMSLALRMDIVDLSRMSGRPSRQFPVVTASRGPG